MEEVLSEQVVLDGKRVMVTLDKSGVLQWRGDKPAGQLVVANDLIGFRSSGSRTILLYTFKLTEFSSSFCGKATTPGRKRKDLAMEFSDDAPHKVWCDSIQRILDESGIVSSFTGWEFLLIP